MGLPTLVDSRAFHADVLAELPREHLAITDGDAAFTAALAATTTVPHATDPAASEGMTP